MKKEDRGILLYSTLCVIRWIPRNLLATQEVSDICKVFTCLPGIHKEALGHYGLAAGNEFLALLGPTALLVPDADHISGEVVGEAPSASSEILEVNLPKTCGAMRIVQHEDVLSREIHAFKQRRRAYHVTKRRVGVGEALFDLLSHLLWHLAVVVGNTALECICEEVVLMNVFLDELDERLDARIKYFGKGFGEIHREVRRLCGTVNVDDGFASAAERRDKFNRGLCSGFCGKFSVHPSRSRQVELFPLHQVDKVTLLCDRSFSDRKRTVRGLAEQFKK